jgi:hypothetical protein
VYGQGNYRSENHEERLSSIIPFFVLEDMNEIEKDADDHIQIEEKGIQVEERSEGEFPQTDLPEKEVVLFIGEETDQGDKAWTEEDEKRETKQLDVIRSRGDIQGQCQPEHTKKCDADIGKLLPEEEGRVGRRGDLENGSETPGQYRKEEQGKIRIDPGLLTRYEVVEKHVENHQKSNDGYGRYEGKVVNHFASSPDYLINPLEELPKTTDSRAKIKYKGILTVVNIH